jgi:hypothetical protein
MKKKIINLFQRVFTYCRKSFRKVIDFVTRKKRPKLMENHYAEPVYLLFPDDYSDKAWPGFEGKNVVDQDKTIK